MQCEEARELLHAYIDGELGLRDAQALDSHLTHCAQCSAEREIYASLRQQVEAHADYHRAPEALRQRIRSALPQPQASKQRAQRWSWHWLNAGAALATSIAVGWTVFVYTSLPSPHERLAEDVISAHVRSLMSNRLVDIASSDQHTVKPWFAGKIDFAPRVQDLTGDGFPLIGGRLDYVDHRPVAALVYRRRQHIIDLIEYPSTERAIDAPPVRSSRNGYNVVYWTRGGMAYWAASDVDPTDLMTLAGLVTAR